MAYATIEDVESRFERELDEHEVTVATQRLEDAETLIKVRVPDLDQKILDGVISEDLVIMAEVDAVIALIRNPDAKVGETDGNYSYQLNWATATGRLTIPDHYWTLFGVRGGWGQVGLKFQAVDELYNGHTYYGYPWYAGGL